MNTLACLLLLVLVICSSTTTATNNKSIGYNDAVTDFRVSYPQDGDTVLIPFRFRFHVEASSSDAFKAQYGDKFVCVELQNITWKCSPILQLRITMEDLPEDRFIASVYISDLETSEKFHENTLSFSVVSTAEFYAHVDLMVEETRATHKFPQDANILQWAEEFEQHGIVHPFRPPTNDSGAMLIIGVKIAVLTNFARRQAIRETWGNMNILPENVKKKFLGCKPQLVGFSPQARKRFEDAIQLEQAVYGDLLTEKLGCEDSHLLLADKVSAFFEWLVAELPETELVMMTDDDVYLRVDEVVADLNSTDHQRLYVGELEDTLSADSVSPIRDVGHPYFTSYQSYPLNHFIPYAAGPHFLLSWDCVKFIGKNRNRLVSLDGQDDTSIALWLLTIQVHVQRSPALSTTFPSSNAVHDNSLANGASVSELRIQKDPVTNFRVIYPTDGAMYTIPIEFRAEIGVESVDEYNTYCKDKLLCVEIDGRSSEKQCALLANPSIAFEELPTGNYTSRAFITDGKDGIVRYHESSSTSFSIVDEEELAERTAKITTANREKEMELLQWAEWRQGVVADESNTDKEMLRSVVADLVAMNGDSEPFLVIGVKTAVVENFAYRQAVRETWASSQALPQGVKVIFLGAQEQEQIQKAVDLEKQTYGDLLTDELRCEDSYDDLPNKMKHFLRFASQVFPQTPFVMIADDDIYLRAGRLVNELQMGNRSERLYIGQVWDQLLGHSQAPVRDASERYYISEEHYPLRSYPPFAFGAHYLLSMDCARFIAKNSERLRGIGGMDDVSIAMWLLTMQVHVEHTPVFSSLQLRGCENGHISLSDLTAFGIRSIHSNLIDNRSLCYGFDRNTWQKNDPMVVEIELISPRATFIPLEFQVFVHDISLTKYLEVTVVISAPDKKEVRTLYHPSAETLQLLTKRGCSDAQKIVDPSVLSCHHFSIVLRSVLQQQFQIIETAERIDQAHLEIWRHNLYHADLNAPPLVVGYSKFAVYSAIVFECLFTSAFKHLKRPIVVVSEKVLNDRYESKPDVFVFSVLDRKCEPLSKPGCARYYFDKYASATGGNNVTNPTKFMMISGETETTEGLDEHVLLLSTVSGIQRENYAYVSVASTSFGERLNHIPITLLSPTASKFSEMTTERRFCAYLYARCDRPQREYMFDLLNSIKPVDALGVCAGSSRRPDEMHFKSRYSTWYNDDAVTTFERYRFVIAFENGAVPGYVTEKLINPFLAGSIPIYLGPSTVSELFNPDSFIDCGRFQKLADCASYVMEVHNSPELYAKMRNEPAIRHVTAFNEAFSWHPSVPSRTMAEKVAEILSRE